MNWNEVSIDTDNTEEVSAILTGMDITGLVIEDRDDFADLLSHKVAAWDYIDEELITKNETATPCVKFYLAQSEEGEKTLAEVRERMARYCTAGGTASVRTAPFRDEDWENNWKQYFKPFLIGDHIVVKPRWETYENTDNRIILEIDPGCAFGTGTHETTKMCIEAIDECAGRYPHGNVLDIGTGSGILSIAAAQLGYGDIYAIDIDPDAVKVARENIELSHLSAQIRVETGDLTKTVSGQYDLILANIMADAIIALSVSAASFLKEGGAFICSGIICEKEIEVCEALAKAGLSVQKRKQDGDWLCLICGK
jgi:ribosomal protein L11 methyltransferase